MTYPFTSISAAMGLDAQKEADGRPSCATRQRGDGPCLCDVLWRGDAAAIGQSCASGIAAKTATESSRSGQDRRSGGETRTEGDRRAAEVQFGKYASCRRPNDRLRVPLLLPGTAAGPLSWTWQIVSALSLVANSLQAGVRRDEVVGIAGQAAARDSELGAGDDCREPVLLPSRWIAEGVGSRVPGRRRRLLSDMIVTR